MPGAHFWAREIGKFVHPTTRKIPCLKKLLALTGMSTDVEMIKDVARRFAASF